MSINGGLLAQAKAKNASVRAVVIRADGSTVDLGMIAYYHRNPLIRWVGNQFIALKRLFKEKQ